MRAATFAALALLIGFVCGWRAITARATTAVTKPTAKLNAAFSPERLGQGTTIIFGFTIATTTGQVPSPLTSLDLYYPDNLGIGTSGLGLETCSAATLEAYGPEGCPSQSQMGYGKGLVEIPFGPEILSETDPDHDLHGARPRRAPRAALLRQRPLPRSPPRSSSTASCSPPAAPSAATSLPRSRSSPPSRKRPTPPLVQLRSTIGPLHLTYYEHTRGKFRSYHPRGIVLPSTCPRGGFHFAASFFFEDGSHTSAHATVPCPR